MTANSPTEARITVADAANLLSVSTRRVHELLAEGAIKRDDAGKLTIVAVVHGYVGVLKGERAAKTVAATDNAFRQARAEELAIRVAERSRKLVEAARSEAVNAVDELVGTLRTELAGVPAHLTVDLALRRRAEDLIDAALQRTADRCLAEADRAPPSSRVADTAAENDARPMGMGEPVIRARRGTARSA